MAVGSNGYRAALAKHPLTPVRISSLRGDEKCEQSTISPTAEGVTVFSAKQLFAVVCRQPIPDTHSQSPNALHAPYACR